jgi:Tol biopolymer transport system component
MTRALKALAVSLAVCAAAAGSASASFPGRNGKIAYLWVGESAYRAGPTETSIRTVDPQTHVVRVLYDCPLRTDQGVPYTDCSLSAPSWAPDGSSFAFPLVRITPNFTGQPWRFDPALGLLNPGSGSYEEHLTAHQYADVAWSPAGHRLLLTRVLPESGPSAMPGIYLASLDRTELQQIGPALSQSPDWSSRGEIAFGHYRDRSCRPVCDEIYVTRVNGTPHRLIRGLGSTPSWSPRGTKLVFARRRRSVTNIYVVRRNGHGLRRVTRRGGYNPAWSPDGKWIAFIRNGNLLVVRPNGEDARRLVNGMSDQSLGEGPQVVALDWQALPRR